MLEHSSNKVRVTKFTVALILTLAVSGSLAPLPDDEARAQTAGSGDVSFTWAQQFGTSASDGAASVAVDPSDGSPIVAGSTNGAIDPTGSPVDPTTPPEEVP